MQDLAISTIDALGRFTRGAEAFFERHPLTATMFFGGCISGVIPALLCNVVLGAVETFF